MEAGSGRTQLGGSLMVSADDGRTLRRSVGLELLQRSCASIEEGPTRVRSLTVRSRSVYLMWPHMARSSSVSVSPVKSGASGRTGFDVLSVWATANILFNPVTVSQCSGTPQPVRALTDGTSHPDEKALKSANWLLRSSRALLVLVTSLQEGQIRCYQYL